MERNTRILRAQHSRTTLTLGGLAALYLLNAKAHLAPSTHEVYGTAVRAFVAYVGSDVPARDVTQLHVTRFIQARSAAVAPATVESHVKRVRAMFAWAEKSGHVVTNPCAAAKTPTVPVKAGRTMTETTFARMLLYAQEGAYPYRDGAILHVLWDTGMRINEVARLLTSDLDIKARTLRVAAETAKTREERILPFTRETEAVLRDYMVLERKEHRNAVLFPSSASGRAFTQSAISQLVRNIGIRAGVRASAHDFRRAFVARLQAQGMSDTMIMTLTGHKAIDMIKLYGRAEASNNAIKLYRQAFG